MADSWRMPLKEKATDWIPANIIIPSETETPGPFDLDLFPHVKEVLEAVDDPMIRNIILPWAARNAKTTTGIAILLYFSICAPRPSIFASSDEARTDDDINSKIYPMAEACAATRPLLLPEHRRNKKFIHLRYSRIRRAYSGSPSTLAGFPACYYVASEISKWTKQKSNEADAIRLIGQRAKLYPFDRKGIYESTPSLKGSCNIMAFHRKATTQRRQRYVPCPHCGEYQVLVFGEAGEEGPGIKWEKGANDKSDPLIAEKTAWYQCVNGCKIENHHRPIMMRSGKWVPEGMSINEYGELIGQPDVGSSDVSFGPLSSLYSLVISGWGQVAREFLEALGDTEAMRDFINSTLAEEWDPKPQTIEPHVLAKRLCHGERAGIVPAWGSFLTCGIDVQEDAHRFVWTASAWGSGGRGQEIKHGQTISFDDLVRNVLERQWEHADNGEPMQVSLSFMDSGDETELVYNMCRKVHRLLPIKGAGENAKMETSYRERILKPEERRNKLAGEEVKLILVNSHTTNQWLQRHIDGRTWKNEAEYLLSSDSKFDPDFLDQILNEISIREIDKRGKMQTRWERINTSRPNDYRDTIRYSYLAALYVTNNGLLWDKVPQRPDPANVSPPRQNEEDNETYAARDYQDFSAR